MSPYLGYFLLGAAFGGLVDGAFRRRGIRAALLASVGLTVVHVITAHWLTGPWSDAPAWVGVAAIMIWSGLVTAVAVRNALKKMVPLRSVLLLGIAGIVAVVLAAFGGMGLWMLVGG